MRTSPTGPKSVPTPQRQINVSAARRNNPMTRNGGDAELIELNQQVSDRTCDQPTDVLKPSVNRPSDTSLSSAPLCLCLFVVTSLKGSSKGV